MTCDRCSGVGRELSERRGRTLLSFSRPCLPPSLLCATPSLGDFTVLFPWTWPWPSRVYLRPRGPKTSVSRCVSAKEREPVPFRSSNPDFRFCVESGGRTSITVPQLRRLPCEMESAGAGGAAPPPPRQLCSVVTQGRAVLWQRHADVRRKQDVGVWTGSRGAPVPPAELCSENPPRQAGQPSVECPMPRRQLFSQSREVWRLRRRWCPKLFLTCPVTSGNYSRLECGRR